MNTIRNSFLQHKCPPLKFQSLTEAIYKNNTKRTPEAPKMPLIHKLDHSHNYICKNTILLEFIIYFSTTVNQIKYIINSAEENPPNQNTIECRNLLHKQARLCFDVFRRANL